MPAWVVLGELLWILVVSAAGSSEVEGRLRDSLFVGYHVDVLPIRRLGQKVPVRVGMSLSQLISLNEKDEELTTKVYMDQEWIDYRLTWNPDEFEGITSIRISADEVWLPDIVLMNNNDGVFTIALSVDVLLHHNGRVQWQPPALYRSSCGIQVTYFPFDWQNCTMVFRSYTYDASEITLLHPVDEKGQEVKEILIYENTFIDNGQWEFQHKPSRKNTLSSDPLYEDITFYLIIRRKPLFYLINVIIPCILITILAIFVFYLPPDAGETRWVLSWWTTGAVGVRVGLGRLSTAELALGQEQQFTESKSPCKSAFRTCSENPLSSLSRNLDVGRSYPVPWTLLKEDWEYVAFVVDRLFFWIFIVFTTIGTLTIFLDASLHLPPEKPFP
ncbi:PREDICTED: acetylcholine receptor subunit beta-like [Thamnophis sirtalis]|uniref:Acetylcholine receptor subunit beta-like n=1 Tax=Thamnophis sirtalis TaxID=35019 RepID=A0A6I9X701_9SAUR|nr:PREDICTED: acetylcholine receptor subunit beta-like [Thamnophis sirtalis]